MQGLPLQALGYACVRARLHAPAMPLAAGQTFSFHEVLGPLAVRGAWPAWSLETDAMDGGSLPER